MAAFLQQVWFVLFRAFHFMRRDDGFSQGDQILFNFAATLFFEFPSNIFRLDEKPHRQTIKYRSNDYNSRKYQNHDVYFTAVGDWVIIAVPDGHDGYSDEVKRFHEGTTKRRFVRIRHQNNHRYANVAGKNRQGPIDDEVC